MNQVPAPRRGARRGSATQETIAFTLVPSSLGQLLVARSEHGVCAVFLGSDAETLQRELRVRFPSATLAAAGDRALADTAARIAALVEHPTERLELALDLRGTELQRRVWGALQEIPVGERVSYTELARRVGRPHAVRAVASACAANQHAVLIPCHRVVRGDGTLSGFRWGVERKRALLDREAAVR